MAQMSSIADKMAPEPRRTNWLAATVLIALSVALVLVSAIVWTRANRGSAPVMPAAPATEYKTDSVQFGFYSAAEDYGGDVRRAKELVDNFRNADRRFFSFANWSAAEKSEYAQLMTIYLGEEELLARSCRAFESRGAELKASGGQPLVIRPKSCETARR